MPEIITVLSHLSSSAAATVVVILLLSAFFINRIFSPDQDSKHAPTNIPEPSLAWWRRYTIGHGLLNLMLMADSFESAKTFNNWRKQCGPVFRLRTLFGGTEVCISSEEAIRAVNLTKIASFIKPEISRKFLGPLVGLDGILLSEGEQHTRLRRAVMPSMHHNALVSVGDTFISEGKRLAERLGKFDHGCEDVLRQVRLSTFAVIFHTCCGPDALPADEMEKMCEAYVTALLEPPWHILVSSILNHVFWFVDSRRFSWREDLRGYIRETIGRVCEECVRKKGLGVTQRMTPLLSLMTDAETKSVLSNKELVDTMLSFLTAGQLSSSMAIAWALYTLGKEREWQDRVVEELKTWSEAGGIEALNALPTLDVVVQEVLRLYPPFFYSTRYTTERVEVDGFVIPKDTLVRLPVLAVQRNAEIWGADVNEFNPYRFNDDRVRSRRSLFWCLFLFGPRSCIGRRFAIFEIKAFVAQVLLKKEVYIKGDEDEAPTCVGPFGNPLRMKVYFRDRSFL